MRFKSQTDASEMPDLNLVPMMDVIMTILTFFIVVAMTLTDQQKSLNVTLPNPQVGGTTIKLPDPLVVGLTAQGQIGIQSKQVTEAELLPQIQTYLAQNPQGAILLKADKTVSYQQLAKLLAQMQTVGGERVSLAIDQN